MSWFFLRVYFLIYRIYVEKSYDGFLELINKNKKLQFVELRKTLSNLYQNHFLAFSFSTK